MESNFLPMNPAVYKYNIESNESQVEINQILPPISIPEIPGTYRSTNLLSHAPDRCEDLTDTIVCKKPIQDIIAECGQKYIIFKCNCCNKRVAVKYRCHHRCCPYCAWVRSMKWYHKLKNVNFRYPLFLTLTLLPSDNLEELIDKAEKSVPKFRRHFKMKKGISSIEICKRKNKDGKGKWYVHVHLLLDCIWLNGEEASKFWYDLTGAYVKKIKRVYKRKEAILEVCKYITKGLDKLTETDLEEVDKAIKGRRLINTFGIPKSEFSLLDTKEISLPKQCECGGRFGYEDTISKVEFKILRAFSNIIELKFYDTS